MRPGRPTPNFFVVGAARSGTTALARYLEEHPQVFMSPIREPGYFAPDVVATWRPSGWRRNQRGLARYLRGPMKERRGGCVLEWNDYLRLFSNVRDETAIGEASTAYLLSPCAPLEISRSIPGARIIVMLRSPIEQAVSTYLMFRRSGRLRATLSEVIRCGRSSRLELWRRMILEARLMAPGLRRFLTTFPPDRLRWYFHSDFAADPAKVMARVYEFLDVDPGFRPRSFSPYNQSILPRLPFLERVLRRSGMSGVMSRALPGRMKPLVRRLFYDQKPHPVLSPSDHQLLADYFLSDVTTLSGLVGRDLSGWLDGTGDAADG